MASVDVSMLLTYNGDTMALQTSSLSGRGVSSIRVQGSGYDVTFDGDNASAEVPGVQPFVAGTTYAFTITLATTTGDYFTQVVLVAESVPDLDGYVGFIGEGSFIPATGSLTPAGLSAPALPSQGPTSAAGLFAVMTFYPDPGLMCSHPSLTYNPAYNPAGAAWFYYKAADGEETIQIITAPDQNPDSGHSHVWLSPNGVPHFLRIIERPDQGDYGMVEVELLALEPVPYGTQPPAATTVLSYSYVHSDVSTLGSVSVHWDADGTPVAAVAFLDSNNGGADMLLVATPGTLVANPIQRQSRYYGGDTLVRLADGSYHYTSMGEEF